MSNAYNYQPQAAPPSSGGGALKVILIILGVLLILCCGGVGITVYVAYTGVNAIMVEGAKQALKDSPEAQAALGEVQSVSIDTTASGKQDTLVVNITGSKGTGTVTLAKDGKSAELKMSDGRVIPLALPAPKKEETEVKLPDLNSTTEEAEEEAETTTTP
jgi:hypothetical protein